MEYCSLFASIPQRIRNGPTPDKYPRQEGSAATSFQASLSASSPKYREATEERSTNQRLKIRVKNKGE
jgi:hypothetical protein